MARIKQFSDHGDSRATLPTTTKIVSRGLPLQKFASGLLALLAILGIFLAMRLSLDSGLKYATSSYTSISQSISFHANNNESQTALTSQSTNPMAPASTINNLASTNKDDRDAVADRLYRLLVGANVDDILAEALGMQQLVLYNLTLATQQQEQVFAPSKYPQRVGKWWQDMITNKKHVL